MVQSRWREVSGNSLTGMVFGDWCDWIDGERISFGWWGIIIDEIEYYEGEDMEWREVYRYQDRVSEAITGDWSQWSDETATASSTREVREQVQYRSREASKVIYHYFRWGGWSEWIDGAPDDRFNPSDYETQAQSVYRYRTKR